METRAGEHLIFAITVVSVAQGLWLDGGHNFTIVRTLLMLFLAYLVELLEMWSYS